MSTKHTPGPWEVRSDEIAGDVWISPEGDTSCGCAIFQCVGAHGFEAKRSFGQLAASAPDMLEALRKILKGTDRGLEAGALGTIFELAESAIAKATGEEPTDDQ